MKSILALDPANVCGVAFGQCEGGRWLSTPMVFRWFIGEGDVTPGARLATLEAKMGAYLCGDAPLDLIVYEDASFGSSKNRHVQSLHAELRGVIKLVAHRLQVEALAINPMTLKAWTCDNGRATKTQMMAACRTLYQFDPRDDNEADARCLLEMGLAYVSGTWRTSEPKAKPARKRSAKPAAQLALFGRRR